MMMMMMMPYGFNYRGLYQNCCCCWLITWSRSRDKEFDKVENKSSKEFGIVL